MKEIFDIVAAQAAAEQAGMKTALATVVKVEGSSYRREGARMLVREDGLLTGAISGGCLEGDALRKALLVMAEQKPVLLTYDSMDEEDAKLGVQLGCNGIVHILIEPVDQASAQHPVALLAQACGRRERALLATLFSLDDRHAPHPGTCLLLQGRATQTEVHPGAPWAEALAASAATAMAEGTLELATCGEWTALLDVLEPPLSLLVFGAGNDAVPLVKMAALLGWRCTVVDGRPGHATAARFPEAAGVLVAKAGEALPQLSIDARTVAVLMTHNYNYELALLPGLLRCGMPYIGLLGPRKKRHRLLDELSAAGEAFTPEELATLHGPTGLDIGAQTAEEIALSILAEIKQVLAAATGISLRTKPGPIHADQQGAPRRAVL